jgi:GT2 family glycosyltransferase
VLISIVIPTAKSEAKTIESLKHCPLPYELLITHANGLGEARHNAIIAAKNELVAMFDDDIIIYPQLWQHVQSLKSNEFLIAHVGEHISTRVFVIHKADYLKVGGFDPKIKYIFEDGDFYLRAQEAGLVPKIVPQSLYEHPYHPPRTQNRKTLIHLSWEYSRLYVKYKRNLHNYPTDFFIRPLDYKVFLFHFPIKIIGIIFWWLHK